MSKGSWESLLSVLGQGPRGRTARALACAVLQMGGPPRPPSGVATATSCLRSPTRAWGSNGPHPSWAEVFISREAFPFTVKSIHWIFWKA